MKKIESLRALLLASVPALGRSPEALATYVDKGHVTARPASLSFEYGYTATLDVLGYAGDLDALIVPVLAWVADNQPELLEAGERRPFKFESERLDDDSWDVSITIELTELVRVEARAGGGLTATHLDEPRLVDAFAGVQPVNLWRGLLDDLLGGDAGEAP